MSLGRRGWVKGSRVLGAIRLRVRNINAYNPCIPGTSVSLSIIITFKDMGGYQNPKP